ncbi:MAG: succinate dehydrogenase assembly factor 2 [Burkholderiales bacterium]
MDPADLRRLEWSCRRGMLENDLILREFMRRHGAGLEGEKLMSFKTLLNLSDGDLWDLIGGRSDTTDAALGSVVNMLRDCAVSCD